MCTTSRKVTYKFVLLSRLNMSFCFLTPLRILLVPQTFSRIGFFPKKEHILRIFILFLQDRMDILVHKTEDLQKCVDELMKENANLKEITENKEVCINKYF